MLAVLPPVSLVERVSNLLGESTAVIKAGF